MLAESPKAMPSLGPRSGWGGPLRWRHIEELQAEDETETRSIKHKRALRCAAGGSAWTQATLFDKWLTATDKCRRRGAARGTMWHRHFGCDAEQAKRRDLCPYMADSACALHILYFPLGPRPDARTSICARNK